MSDHALRSGLIRLAHSNPSLRADLLPLIGKKASKAVSHAAAKGAKTSKGVLVTLVLSSEIVFKATSSEGGLNIEELTPRLQEEAHEQASLAKAFIASIVKATQKAPEVWGFTFTSAVEDSRGHGPMAKLDGHGLYVWSSFMFHLNQLTKDTRNWSQDDLNKFNATLMRIVEVWF